MNVAQRQRNRFLTLHNVENVGMTLSQRYFTVTSTSVKGISKPICLVKSMDL